MRGGRPVPRSEEHARHRLSCFLSEQELTEAFEAEEKPRLLLSAAVPAGKKNHRCRFWSSRNVQVRLSYIS